MSTRSGPTRFTSQRILDAESCVSASVKEPAPFQMEAVIDPILGEDQVDAVVAMTESDRRVTTVIGPAGAGKTTLLKSVAQTWEAAGRDVMILTLSAAAARVVTEETSIPASTIASWAIGQVDMPRGGLVVIDEASMVPMLTLENLVRVSEVYGTRLAFVGDYAQMGAPEAGGLLHDLAAGPSAVTLTAVRRFTNVWEREASKKLRSRDRAVADVYDINKRISPTTQAAVVDNVAAAWATAVATGADSIVVVDTAEDAADMSARCQGELLGKARLGAPLSTLADGNRVHVGDQIQSRLNSTEIDTSDGRRVLNRDVWTAIALEDGLLLARNSQSGAIAKFPTEYQAESIVLAYATTIAGAQGRTVDVSHVVVTPSTSAASLYVGMTRGRQTNRAWVIQDGHDHDEFGLGTVTAVDGFRAALGRDPEGQLSATRIAARFIEAGHAREAERAVDRWRASTETVWDTTNQLTATAHRTVADDRDRIVTALTRHPTIEAQQHAIKTAVDSTGWHSPTAVDKFVRHLKRPVPTEPDTPADTPQPSNVYDTATVVHDTTATFER